MINNYVKVKDNNIFNNVMLLCGFYFCTYFFLLHLLTPIYAVLDFLVSNGIDNFFIAIAIVAPITEEIYKYVFIKNSNNNYKYYFIYGISFQYIEAIIIGIDNVFIRLLLPLHYAFQIIAYHISNQFNGKYYLRLSMFLHSVYNVSIFYNLFVHCIILYYLILLLIILNILKQNLIPKLKARYKKQPY